MAEDNGNNPYVPGGSGSAFGPSSGSQGGQALSPDALSLLVESMREMGFKLSQDVSGDVAEKVRSVLESSSGSRYVTARLRGMANVINQMPVGEERRQATERYGQLTGAVQQVAPGVTAPLHTAQGQSQYFLQQAVQKTVQSNEEKYRQSYLQSARSTLGSGQNLTEPELKQIENYAKQLRSAADALREKVQSLGEPTTDAERGEQIKLRNELTELNNEASGFETVLERGLNQQSQDNQKLLGFIGNVIGALGVGQLASQFALRDPFRFETAPALAAAGRTSEIGQIVSQALMSAEEYSLNLNQMGLQTGLVIGGLGANQLMQRGALADIDKNQSARRALGRRGGAGLILGGVIAGAGATGMFDDVVQALPFAKDDETIVGTEIAREVLNAPRLAEFYQTSRAGLLQRGGTGADLGFTQGAEGGNVVLGNIARNQTSLSGMSLEQLGLSTSDIGGLLSSAAMVTRSSGQNLDEAVELAGNMQTLFGVSAEQTIGTLASIQRAGVAPGRTRDVFMSSMGVIANEEGELSNFAANVLVPALNQVLESTSIQNVARSTEELQRDVFGFRQALEGNDRLGTLLESSPDTFARIFQGTQQAVQQATNDPGLLAYFRSLGASFSEIYAGSPQVAVSSLNQFVRGGLASGRLSADTTQDQLLSFIGPYVSSGVLPFSDPQVASALVMRMLNGEEFSTQGDFNQAIKEAEAAVSERAGNLPKDLTTLLEEMARGTTTLNESMNNSIETIIQMQQSITEFTESDKFESKLDQGMARITAAFFRQLGKDNLADMYVPTPRKGNAGTGSIGAAMRFMGLDDPGILPPQVSPFRERFEAMGGLLGIDQTFVGGVGKGRNFTFAMADFIANNPELALRLYRASENGFSEEEIKGFEDEGVINNNQQVAPGSTSTMNNLSNPGTAQQLASVSFLLQDAELSV